jgi:hypothetical protein
MGSSGTILWEKKVLNIKRVFWFYPQLFSHSKKNSTRYCQKFENVFTYSTRYSCQILIKLGFSRQILEKYSDIKFHKNPSSCSMRTDTHTDVTKLIVAFQSFANAPKKSTFSEINLTHDCYRWTKITRTGPCPAVRLPTEAKYFSLPLKKTLPSRKQAQSAACTMHSGNSFSRRQSGRVVNLTTHLYLVPRSRTRASRLPTPRLPTLRGT